jgi:hypothetical protein
VGSVGGVGGVGSVGGVGGIFPLPFTLYPFPLKPKT